MNNKTADSAPLVSVILPVFNAERYLDEAISSVLNQSYANIEVIAIDDGSTDGSKAILEKWQSNEPRLKIYSQPNLGIVKSLNRGVSLAKGMLLARMDADDISAFNRIEQQVKAMLDNPKAVLVTSHFRIIDRYGRQQDVRYLPLDYSGLRRSLYLRNPICHAGVLYRKPVVIAAGLYRGDCGPTEDYDLWTRMLDHGEFVIIDDILSSIRVHSKSVTVRRAKIMEDNMDTNLAQYWSKYPFKSLQRQDISLQISRYQRMSPRRWRPCVKVMLRDLIRISIKLIKRRCYRLGITQLWRVSTADIRGARALLSYIASVLTSHF